MASIADVVNYVPGITSHQGENNRDQLVIRGNSSSADFFVNGVRDDVQYYRDLYNVEQVEALKGPNAMTFGRGGGGGVINRVTKQAGFTNLREFQFSGRFVPEQAVHRRCRPNLKSETRFPSQRTLRKFRKLSPRCGPGKIRHQPDLNFHAGPTDPDRHQLRTLSRRTGGGSRNPVLRRSAGRRSDLNFLWRSESK